MSMNRHLPTRRRCEHPENERTVTVQPWPEGWFAVQVCQRCGAHVDERGPLSEAQRERYGLPDLDALR